MATPIRSGAQASIEQAIKDKCATCPYHPDNLPEPINVELLKKAYHFARNAAAGLTNYCEETASTRRCERELEQAEKYYREAHKLS